jgi:hypothetical protein
VVDEIFHNRARLGQHQRLCGARCLDGDQRRFTKWMNLLQLRRSELVGAAFESLELIFQL